jgi:hypothetical protein
MQSMTERIGKLLSIGLLLALAAFGAAKVMWWIVF